MSKSNNENGSEAVLQDVSSSDDEKNSASLSNTENQIQVHTNNSSSSDSLREDNHFSGTKISKQNKIKKKKEEKDEKTQDEDKKKKEKEESVGTFQLFRFASWYEILQIFRMILLTHLDCLFTGLISF
jgi:hypothetical protein